MPRRKRRNTRWFDLMGIDIPILSSAGGSIGFSSVLDEATLEGFGGPVTLLKVVGNIYVARSLGANGTFVAAIRVTDSRLTTPSFSVADLRIGEDYEDSGVVWTYLWSDKGLTSNNGRIEVDVSSKRVITQQQRLDFVYNNASLTAAADNLNLDYHLRFLILF